MPMASTGLKTCTRLLAAVPEGKRPIVVGRREGMQAEHVPWASRFGRKFSNFWVQASGGPAVSDTQSGMRLYPLPETLDLPVRARRFQFEVEVLVKACWYGIPVLEAPIQVSYAPKGERISHYRGFVDFMRNSAAFTRLIFGGFSFCLLSASDGRLQGDVVKKRYALRWSLAGLILLSVGGLFIAGLYPPAVFNRHACQRCRKMIPCWQMPGMCSCTIRRWKKSSST